MEFNSVVVMFFFNSMTFTNTEDCILMMCVTSVGQKNKNPLYLVIMTIF